MGLEQRATRLTFWLGFLVAFFVTSQPLIAIAADFRPPRRGVPGRREGGGTRDPRAACVLGNPARLAALMPDTNFGLTTAEYPRFFWFMPKTRAKFAEFKLSEVDGELRPTDLVYSTTFRVTGNPGIASLTLPNTANLPPLEAGKDYHWSIALVCDPNNRKRDIFVEGWIQRTTVEPSLTEQLVKASPADQINLYARNGFWFDTLNTLATLRCKQPEDAKLTQNWTELMKQVKLSAIAEQPFAQTCSNQK